MPLIEDRGSRIEDRGLKIEDRGAERRALFYRIQENVLPRRRRWRILAGGETTGYWRQNSSSPERATDQSFGPAPFQGANSHLLRYRWFLHRPISNIPPGRKMEKLFLEIYTFHFR